MPYAPCCYTLTVVVFFFNTLCHAAVITFDDLATGPLPTPGVINSDGIEITLAGSGDAAIEPIGLSGRLLSLANGVSASFNVPNGTAAASIIYVDLVSTLAAFIVNGETLAIAGAGGTSGMIGGVDYQFATPNPVTLDRLDLTGPLESFAVVSGASGNGVLLDEVTFVPAPATGGMLGFGLFLVWRRTSRAGPPTGSGRSATGPLLR